VALTIRSGPARARRAFSVVELLTTLAGLVIVLGLMVSLARHVRLASAELLTKEVLRRLDEAMANYVHRNGMLPSTIPAFIEDSPEPLVEMGLQRAAERNNEAFVRALKSDGLFAGRFDDLSIAYYDEAHVRDAWGSPIVFMAKMHPAIGMNPRGWFFFSAGPDRQYLTRDDNINSYDQPLLRR
jgi:hypothetical protein